MVMVGGRGTGWGYLQTVLKLMRASSHPRQRGAGRRRGKLVGGPGEPGELAGRCRERLVRDSGEPGELADAEEDWSEAQGSQGSYLA